MDKDLRDAERNQDVQRQFHQLCRSGLEKEAFALAQNNSIQVEATVEYHYSYRFRRANGNWFDPYVTKTIEGLVAAVAKGFRNGHIARAMEMTGQETRGQLIKVPMLCMNGKSQRWFTDELPMIICPKPELESFLKLVIDIKETVTALFGPPLPPLPLPLPSSSLPERRLEAEAMRGFTDGIT